MLQDMAKLLGTLYCMLKLECKADGAHAFEVHVVSFLKEFLNSSDYNVLGTGGIFPH